MRLLRAFTQRKTSPLPPPVTEMMLVADQQVQLTFKRHASARRFTLRLMRDGAGFAMTMPRRASMADARAFALKSESWMLRVLARRVPKVNAQSDGTGAVDTLYVHVYSSLEVMLESLKDDLRLHEEIGEARCMMPLSRLIADFM